LVHQKIAKVFPRNAEGAEDILTLVALAKIVQAVEYAKLDHGIMCAITQALILRVKWVSAEEVTGCRENLQASTDCETLNWRHNWSQSLKKQLVIGQEILIIAIDIIIPFGKDTRKTTTGVKQLGENTLSQKEIMPIILDVAVAGAVRKGPLMIFAFTEVEREELRQIMNGVAQVIMACNVQSVNTVIMQWA